MEENNDYTVHELTMWKDHLFHKAGILFADYELTGNREPLNRYYSELIDLNSASRRKFLSLARAENPAADDVLIMTGKTKALMITVLKIKNEGIDQDEFEDRTPGPISRVPRRAHRSDPNRRSGPAAKYSPSTRTNPGSRFGSVNSPEEDSGSEDL